MPPPEQRIAPAKPALERRFSGPGPPSPRRVTRPVTVLVRE